MGLDSKRVGLRNVAVQQLHPLLGARNSDRPRFSPTTSGPTQYTNRSTTCDAWRVRGNAHCFFCFFVVMYGVSYTFEPGKFLELRKEGAPVTREFRLCKRPTHAAYTLCEEQQIQRE